MKCGGELNRVDKYSIDLMVDDLVGEFAPAQAAKTDHHVDGFLTRDEIRLFHDIIDTAKKEGFSFEEPVENLYTKSLELKERVAGNADFSLPYWSKVLDEAGKEVQKREGLDLGPIIAADFLNCGNPDGITSFDELSSDRINTIMEGGAHCKSITIMDLEAKEALIVGSCCYTQSNPSTQNFDKALRELSPKLSAQVNRATTTALGDRLCPNERPPEAPGNKKEPAEKQKPDGSPIKI